jgi:hydrophobe/amphiphile efflux-1 (HAE1) family protein
MNLTKHALLRPVAITVLTLAVIAIGVYSFQNLEVDYLPSVTYPMIKIHIWWRGATPEEIETNVAEPIERVMATVDNLDYLSSSSIEGMYTLLVNFKYGVNVEEAYQDVTAAMGRAARSFPPDMDPPVIIKADPSQLPVMEVTVTSAVRDLVWLRDWSENWLTDRLNAVDGTAGVEVVGGLAREIRVHLDPRRLEAYGLTPAIVSNKLFEENVEMFAGRITTGRHEIIARTMGEFESLDEVQNIVIATVNGRDVRLVDVASVEDSHEEMRVNTRFNSEPCVKLNVLKQSDANTVKVSEAVIAKLNELRPQIPEDIVFGYVENQGDYVMGAINSVQTSAIFAAILVILVVYLFLGRWRQVVVMLVALPVTLFANFFIMKSAGFSLNLFSLGGLVVALGVILDNSIVVMENITRLKSEGHSDYALEGTNEVSGAIFAATLTFLAIFLPFLLIQGLSSLLFKELVLVIASIVLISLLVALTLTPALTSGLLKREKEGKLRGLAAGFESIVGAYTRFYQRILSPVLRFRVAIVIIFLALFAVGIFLAGKTGSEFLPQPDDGRVMVKVKMPAGTAVSVVDSLLMKIEKSLEGMPEIKNKFTLAGARVWGLATYEIANEGEVDIQLVPKSERDISTPEFVEKIKPIVGKIQAPGAIMPVMQMKIKGIRQVGTQQVEVKISGTDIEEIYAFAQKVRGALNSADGLTNVQISMDINKPEYRIHIDRARASALGLSTGHIARTLRALVTGVVSTQFRDGNEYYDIRVMVPEQEFSSKEDLEWLVLRNENGRPIYLRDVAEVRRSVGPIEIVREDQIKQVIVAADAQGISVGEAVNRARSAVESLERPVDVGFEMGGQAEMMKENQRNMMLILGFAILFAFVILAIKFESFSLPFLIILNIPLALTGAFLALFLSGDAFGVTAQIGLVVMMGGITSQGVVLMTLAEDMRKMGKSRIEAIKIAAPIRVRPILMTQLTTICGLIPLALNLGEGGDLLKPMAVAVIGGLLYSLFLTLFFLPSAYSIGAGQGGEEK